MPDLAHEGYNTTKNITHYIRMASISLGILVQSLSFLDVRRLIQIDESGEEDEASVKDGQHDYLAKVLIDQVPEICDSSLIKYTSGLATLFKSDRAHRELLPRVFLAWDLRDSSKLVGACNTLRFVCDEAIGTSILTDAYLSKNSLPRFDTQWTLLDIICSRRSPAATLLAMSVYAAVSKGRTRKAVGLLAISINERSRKVFHKLGFMEHKFKSQGDTRYLMYCRIESVRMTNVLSRLTFAENELMVQSVCFRGGLTKKTAGNIYDRC